MSETIVSPVVLVAVIIACILICILPRSRAIVPFLAASILIPTDQVLLIGGLHFPMLRVLILFGFVRIFRERTWPKWKLFSGGMNKIDVAVILFTVVVAVNEILLFQQWGAVINQLGDLYSVFGVYFLLRFLIRDDKDIVLTIRTFAWLTIIISVIMSYEFVTGHNPYALLGGARASVYASLAERSERFRADGPFAISILAGTFGAVMVPLFVALWFKEKKHKTLIVAGSIAATVITLTSNSSTPMLGYAAGVLALCLWPARRWMRLMRWGVVLMLAGLQVVLKNPVWHLITHIDVSGGSSSWHRYMLIDQCIRHFSDWWLLGVKDTSTWGWDMWDTANQYVGTADGSGLVALILFVAIIVYGFRYLGKARRVPSDGKRRLFLWGLGAALFAHAVSFFGVSYFDQTMVAWYGLLALICAAVRTYRQNESGRLMAGNRINSGVSIALASAEQGQGRNNLRLTPHIR